MPRRLLFRVVVLALALACGWGAIAIARVAHVRACIEWTYANHNPRTNGSQIVAPPCKWYDVGVEGRRWVWKTGPTIAAIGFGSVAFVFALFAISRRQGTLLMYRVRRPA